MDAEAEIGKAMLSRLGSAFEWTPEMVEFDNQWDRAYPPELDCIESLGMDTCGSMLLLHFVFNRDANREDIDTIVNAAMAFGYGVSYKHGEHEWPSIGLSMSVLPRNLPA